MHVVAAWHCIRTEKTRLFSSCLLACIEQVARRFTTGPEKIQPETLRLARAGD